MTLFSRRVFFRHQNQHCFLKISTLTHHKRENNPSKALYLIVSWTFAHLSLGNQACFALSFRSKQLFLNQLLLWSKGGLINKLGHLSIAVAVVAKQANFLWGGQQKWIWCLHDNSVFWWKFAINLPFPSTWHKLVFYSTSPLTPKSF